MISIISVGKDNFLVKISEKQSKSNHLVKLDESYYKYLTNCEISKEELIEKSFKFLLKREKKEEILSKFNLNVISKYFIDYEQEIKK